MEHLKLVFWSVYLERIYSLYIFCVYSQTHTHIYVIYVYIYTYMPAWSYIYIYIWPRYIYIYIWPSCYQVIFHSQAIQDNRIIDWGSLASLLADLVGLSFDRMTHNFLESFKLIGWSINDVTAPLYKSWFTEPTSDVSGRSAEAHQVYAVTVNSREDLTPLVTLYYSIL